jgi:hypothetical protein
MTRLILGLTLAATIGCTNIQPVGPLAGKWGNSSGAKGKAAKDKDIPPEPVTVPAPKPPPPVTLVYPDEVLPENPQAALQKLMNELDADRKNMPAPPVTAEVSRYKNGVKQN